MSFFIVSPALFIQPRFDRSTLGDCCCSGRVIRRRARFEPLFDEREEARGFGEELRLSIGRGLPEGAYRIVEIIAQGRTC